MDDQGVCTDCGFNENEEPVQGILPWSPPEHGLARHTDPETSHEAAESLDVSKLEQLVVDYLLEHGDNIVEKVCAGLGRRWQSISPRFRPLCNKGRIYEAGFAIASSGRRVIVWSANPEHKRQKDK